MSDTGVKDTDNNKEKEETKQLDFQAKGETTIKPPEDKAVTTVASISTEINIDTSNNDTNQGSLTMETELEVERIDAASSSSTKIFTESIPSTKLVEESMTNKALVDKTNENDCFAVPKPMKRSIVKKKSDKLQVSVTETEANIKDSLKKLNSQTPQEDVFMDPQPSTSSNQIIMSENNSRNRINLYAPDVGPHMYNPTGILVTPPIITKNLPQVFQFLPVHGKPSPDISLKEFYRNKIREYVGCGLSDEEFKDLESYCSPEFLKTGKEVKMQTDIPLMGVLNPHYLSDYKLEDDSAPPNLCILKKNKESKKDARNIKKLKYRGVRVLQPFKEYDKMDDITMPCPQPPTTSVEEELEPGVDLLYQVRIYRPYAYNVVRDRYTRGRHSVFSCDVLLTGRHKLSALRDRFVCHNDFDMRVDVSDHPDVLPNSKAKEVFPSGFLFINNVFYVDTREGCIDYSAPIRDWAVRKKIGNFPKKDMCEVRLDELVIKLGHPEVYVHQGNCEHVFIFSSVRLLSAADGLVTSRYPCSSVVAQNQTVYCATCAEFSAKWVVVGSARVPFDPGFFCDKCFKLYMYKDGQKIGEFKAYRYRGNALNVLRPI